MAARKRKKNNSTITVILLVGVLILGGYFMLTGEDPLGLFSDLENMEVPSVAVSLTEGAQVVGQIVPQPLCDLAGAVPVQVEHLQCELLGEPSDARASSGYRCSRRLVGGLFCRLAK